MKRFLSLLLILFLLPLNAFAAPDPQALYVCKSARDFHLRDKPDGRFVESVPDASTVYILEWPAEEEWVYASYKGQRGYAKLAWLYQIRSLDPANAPLHNVPNAVEGMLVLKEQVLIKAGDYEGTLLEAGDTVCGRPDGEGNYIVPVWRSELILTSSQADFVPFADPAAAEPGDVIGAFTTFYGDQQGKGKAKEREFNIMEGSVRTNGATVQPGESFSFNALCYPYSKKNGYQLAPNISKKGTGYGGGICQFTTTLYNALLSTPLLITEWAVHRYTGVVYAPQLFDAAVGDYSDLAFTNTLSYPVRLDSTVENGVINTFIVRAD